MKEGDFHSWEKSIRQQYGKQKYYLSMGEGVSLESTKKQALQSLILSLKSRTSLSQNYSEILKNSSLSAKMVTNMFQQSDINLQNVSYSSVFKNDGKYYIFALVNRKKMASFYGDKIKQNVAVLNRLFQSKNTPRGNDCQNYFNYLENLSFYGVFKSLYNIRDQNLIIYLDQKIQNVKDHYSLGFINTSSYVEKKLKKMWKGNMKPTNNRLIVKTNYKYGDMRAPADLQMFYWQNKDFGE